MTGRGGGGHAYLQSREHRFDPVRASKRSGVAHGRAIGSNLSAGSSSGAILKTVSRKRGIVFIGTDDANVMGHGVAARWTRFQ